MVDRAEHDDVADAGSAGATGAAAGATGAAEAARAAWTRLGDGSALVLAAVDLFWVELPFRRAVRTATASYERRPLGLVRVRATDGDGVIEGWGECAALGDDAYVAEDLPSAFASLERALVPALVGAARDRGRLPGPSQLDEVRDRGGHTPMAFAALEMSVADAHLRASGRAFGALIGVGGREIAAGAVAGTAATTDALVATVASLTEAGAGRVKLKIGPGWDVEPVAAVKASFPALSLQVDANGSYVEDATEHLAGLDRFGLLCIEQPFGRGELDAHVRLARRLKTPVCVDESLDSPARVREAVDRGACSVVCVKPARLGGIGAALEVVSWCTAAGVPMWIGGMFESAYARGANAALAALPGFAWPGDLSPASWYLAEDLVAPDSHPGPVIAAPGPARLTAVVPPGPGMGPAPDPDLVARHLVRHEVVVAGPR